MVHAAEILAPAAGGRGWTARNPPTFDFFGRAMNRIAPVAAALWSMSMLAAGAQPVNERDLKAAPGHDVQAGVYTAIKPDCTSGPLPAIRLVVPPGHGTVTVKRGLLKATNVKQCLGLEVPAFVALYRAADGFAGADTFDLEISYASGRKQLQHFSVTVSPVPGGGQGI